MRDNSNFKTRLYICLECKFQFKGKYTEECIQCGVKGRIQKLNKFLNKGMTL